MSKSKIFLYLCLSFILGVFVQSLLNFPMLLWLGILFLGIILATTFWGKNKKIVVAGFCLAILVGGAWRFNQISNQSSAINQYNDKEKIILIGVVVDEPDERADNIRYKIMVEKIGSQKLISNILLIAKKYPSHNYGDRLEISGKLKTPKNFDDFDYQKYLAKDEIYSVIYYPEIKLVAARQGNFIKQALFGIKNKFDETVSQILVEPQAAYLAGLLFGEKRGLPADLINNFKITGTTHIIALSGYNITIIAFSLMALFNFFMIRRVISFWISTAMIVLFVLMTGAAASVVRAAVMGILMLLALQVGRIYSIRNALIFAGAIMIYVNPKILTFDLGFQLSFAATLGLIYISPLLQNQFTKKFPENKPQKSVLGWQGILIATLAAQIGVLPLLLINFGQLSLIAPLANFLILFFIPLTMFFGFLAALAGIFWLALGKTIGWIAWLFLTYEIKTIEFLAKIPFAAINVKWNWWLGAAYYLVLGFLIWRFNGRNKKTRVFGLGKNK